MLDGEAVEDGDIVNLLELALGEHTLATRAEDTAGNVSETSVTFSVEATLATLTATVERLAAEGGSTTTGLRRACWRSFQAQAAVDAGRIGPARNLLRAFIAEVEDQRGEHITDAAADLLIRDARAVLEAL